MANEPGNPQIEIDMMKLEAAAAEQYQKRADGATISRMEEAVVEPKKMKDIMKNFAATEKIPEAGDYTAELGDRMAGEPGNAEIKEVEDTRKAEAAVGDQPKTMQGVTQNLLVTANTRKITGFQQIYIDDLESHFADSNKPRDAGESGFYKLPEDMRTNREDLFKCVVVEFSDIIDTIKKNRCDVAHYYNHLCSVLWQEEGKKEENGKKEEETKEENGKKEEETKEENGKKEINGEILEQLLLAMEKNEEVRKWCAMKGNNSPDFPQLLGLLLGGCFIIDVFHKWHSLELSPGKVPKCGEEWAPELWADLLLVENQIPIFILREIIKKVKKHQPNFPELEQLIFHYFKDFVPLNEPEGEKHKESDQSDGKPTEVHLLDFVHQHLLPQGDKKNQVLNFIYFAFLVVIGAVYLYPVWAWIIIPLLCIFAPLVCTYYCLKCLIIFPWKLVKYFFTKWLCCLKGDRNQWKSQRQKPVLQRAIPTATRLREAGVRFKPIEDRGFVVEFEKGELRPPRLHVRNSTKKLLMNLIIWEQCHKKAVKYFINYAIFMDYLVNNSKDIEILIPSRVIEHSLVKDDEVVAVFNGLGKDLVYRQTDDKDKYNFLPKLSNELNKYCEDQSNIWWANLMNEYFKSPWAIMSVLAGVLLILLTVAQSYFSAYSYLRPPS